MSLPREYPTEEELEGIKKSDPGDVLGRAQAAWNTHYGLVKDEEMPDMLARPLVVFVTGGWSGNEDVIEAMRANHLFWILYWESSNRGGRHAFFAAAPER